MTDGFSGNRLVAPAPFISTFSEEKGIPGFKNSKDFNKHKNFVSQSITKSSAEYLPTGIAGGDKCIFYCNRPSKYLSIQRQYQVLNF